MRYAERRLAELRPPPPLPKPRRTRGIRGPNIARGEFAARVAEVAKRPRPNWAAFGGTPEQVAEMNERGDRQCVRKTLVCWDTRMARERLAWVVVPLDQLRALPAATFETGDSGVYFLWGYAHLLYVGKSNTIGNRLGQHYDNGRRWTRATYLPVRHDMARSVEADFVRRYKPRFNLTSTG